MNDTLRRSRAIRRSLTPCYPGEPTGNVARHLNTLAALISGIVARKSTQLPHIATQVPDGAKPESRVKRLARWVGNDRITEDVYFLPSAEVLLAHLAWPTRVLVIDGSCVGRGGVALMMHVVYTGRALPVAWLVRHGTKGPCPAARHIALVAQVQALIPAGASVVRLGDGECDGMDLQDTLEDAGWSYGCRTAMSMTATWQDATFRLDTRGACSKPGTLSELQEVLFTGEASGPILRICCWAKGDQEPLYLVTHLTAAEEACRLSAKRFRIATFFSDQKSRGFHRHKSPLSEPERLSRLMMAACFAYIWIVSLGSIGVEGGWIGIIHRRHRCDVSLFQLGLRLLDHFLHEDLPIPVAFHISD
jgi:Transposase DDE domain